MNDDAHRERLAECRRRIDAIDVEIVKLLNQRTEAVTVIGQTKKQMASPVYEPKREAEVYANIQAANEGPLPGDALQRIFERVIDEMRRVQQILMRGDS